MVRVLRSVTPGTLRTWSRQRDNENTKNRIFQVIKSGYAEVSEVETIYFLHILLSKFGRIVFTRIILVYLSI